MILIAVNKTHSLEKDVSVEAPPHAVLKLSSSTMGDAGPWAGRSRKLPWSGKNHGSH